MKRLSIMLSVVLAALFMASTTWAYSYIVGQKNSGETKKFEKTEDTPNGTYEGISFIGTYGGNDGPYIDWFEFDNLLTPKGEYLFSKIKDEVDVWGITVDVSPKIIGDETDFDGSGNLEIEEDDWLFGKWEWFSEELSPEFIMVKGGQYFSLWEITAEYSGGKLTADWTTDGLPNLPGLSHVSFLDTGDPNFSGNPVPEPATVLLLGFGLVGLATVGRRRMKKQ
jgi:hypothetical protein